MNERNGMALAGFVVTVCAVLLFAAGFLCVIGVMLNTLIGFIFGGAAGLAALTGLALSGIGMKRAFSDSCGAGFALAGLITGTFALTLVLAMTALLIVAAAI